ncbi:hypothetical protein AS361_15705 [Myroides marinus]|uniref:glycosyltransferase family 2 protein n=1 Tax=Myroides marinus TaxID=703342 RepID=UPI0007422171|nr:glycosyltransferase family 2 protein [Myroides marinus]KUF44495.1 hypothetical protein AS361_15705 [Myroides marinus]
MGKISGVIIAFNEEQYIERCLKSMQGVVDEIVVIDSFSTDKTVEIAQQYNASIVKHPFTGFTDQKNFANDQAQYDYILSLDADEALSDELKQQILHIKPNIEQYEGYSFNILNNYCGQWIKHSNWYPGTKTRLFNRIKGRWYSPTNLHETIKFEGASQTKHLKGDLLHWAYDSYSEHHAKNDRYTTLAATNFVKYKNKKIPVIKIVINPFWKFFKNYFIKKGFLDGFNGFVICSMAAYSTFLKYIKIIELQRKK